MNSHRNSHRLDRNAIIDLLKPVTACDGHERGEADVAVWQLAADNDRWRLDEAVAAVTTVVTTFTGYRIMPGHVSAQVHAQRSRPQPGYAVAELDGPPPASAEHRRREIANVVELFAKRRSMPDGLDVLGAMVSGEVDREAERREARRAERDAMWAAVDACPACSDAGLLPGGEVCQHLALPESALPESGAAQ